MCVHAGNVQVLWEIMEATETLESRCVNNDVCGGVYGWVRVCEWVEGCGCRGRVGTHVC